MDRKTVNATYRNILTKMNVLVNVPGSNDEHMKFIGGHEIVVGGETITIPSHYRRGDIINGNFVTRNFFFSAILDERSTKMIAIVTVVEKTDHSRGGKKSIILDIHPNTRCYDLDKVETILAIGAKEGDVLVPGSDKFIAFKKIKTH